MTDPKPADPKAPGKPAAPPTRPDTDPDDLLLALADMDAAARAQGHSLAEILDWAARNAFGISLTR
jgi:hypothetical protein